LGPAGVALAEMFVAAAINQAPFVVGAR